MHVTSPFLLALLVLLLLPPSTQPRKASQGKGLRVGRHRHRQNRVRGGGRQGRSGDSSHKGPDCSEFSNPGNLFMDCQGRKLSSIPSALSFSRPPDHLLLARNLIQALRNRAFSGYEGLRSLDLQQNRISVLEEEAFLGLTHLTSLLLQHNHLSTLSEEALIPMQSLRYLRLHDNPWSCHCTLESLVRTLQVPSNRNLGNHARCEEPFRLRGRKLKRVDPELLCLEPEPISATADPKGEDGRNATVPLQPSPFRSKPDATTVCHTYLFPTPHMDCRSRDLTEVPSDIPREIVRMDLSQNSLRRLKGRDFVEASRLRSLNLSHNNLEDMDTASLSGLLHLHELDLSNNSLRFFHYGVLEDLYFLSLLRLDGNPWVCDYSIHYLVYWLRLHPGVTHSGLLCHSPPELRGKSVEDYVHSYNRACSQTEQTDPELWNTAMELQVSLEEKEVEPANLRRPQKYRLTRLN
ncbi:leucine-rich repeat-containing protein 17 isoform X2 [Esox lucius]|uniref:LRRCT domain-containing protein n=1 Tax=Esox lucius TaxID=8010 RepID=A0A3P9ANK2_ESOLU|nr:leucine-rich repeat-containing protein 17 isoform X2 [Esox lucius]